MLSSSQKEAVCHGKGPCLTLAGPGSGKTLCLTRRICHLITEEGASPEKILVITFTKAAAMEMKERFDSLMGEGAPVVFGTFHSVFYHILRQETRFRGYQLVDGKKKRQIIKESAFQCKVTLEDDEELEALEREISFTKNMMMPPKQYVAQSYFKEQFIDLYEHYEARKEAYRLLDFDDLLLKTYLLLKEDDAVLRKWQSRFSYLLIDEIQDVNRLQYEIMQLLALPENNLFVVGDDDQSIYGFRGANPSIMFAFENEYPRCRKIVLGENYRCAKAIVEASVRLISHNNKRFDKKIESRNQNEGKVVTTVFEDEMAEVGGICDGIEAQWEKGIPYQNIAVLFRNHNQGQGLAEELKQREIPFYLKERIPNSYQNAIVLDMISYLRLGSGTLWRRDLFRIMNRPNRYLSRASVEREWTTFDAWKRFYKEQPWIYDRIEQLERDISFMKHLSAVGAITYIRKKIGYDVYLKERAKDEEELKQCYGALDVLLALAREEKTIGGLLEKWEERSRWIEKLNSTKQTQNKEGVGLYTLHSSKGLEFSAVFIMGCNEGVIPSPKAESVAQIEEERRLFYVGMTRAKHNLFLSYTKKRMGNPMHPSRFLSEI